MGVYTMALSGSAAVAAAGTVPLGELIGQGWRGALGAWALPAAVALLLWVPFASGHTPPPTTGPAPRSLVRQVPGVAGHRVLRPAVPVLLRRPVMASDDLPGTRLQRCGGRPRPVGVPRADPIALLLPRAAARARDQRAHAVGAALFTAAGLTGLLLAPTAAPYLWAVLLGLGQGASFAVGLSLFVLRSRSPADTARLSAMAQTFGYLIATGGPLLVGTFRDVTRSWSPPLALLLLLLVPQMVAGVLAGRPLHVGRGHGPAA
jgi:MFS transporter, CP family, cyanate transporter